MLEARYTTTSTGVRAVPDNVVYKALRYRGEFNEIVQGVDGLELSALYTGTTR